MVGVEFLHFDLAVSYWGSLVPKSFSIIIDLLRGQPPHTQYYYDAALSNPQYYQSSGSSSQTTKIVMLWLCGEERLVYYLVRNRNKIADVKVFN